jgi:hypothetical protein
MAGVPGRGALPVLCARLSGARDSCSRTAAASASFAATSADSVELRSYASEAYVRGRHR